MEPLYILLAISFYTLPIIIPFLWIELEINEIPQKIKSFIRTRQSIEVENIKKENISIDNLKSFNTLTTQSYIVINPNYEDFDDSHFTIQWKKASSPHSLKSMFSCNNGKWKCYGGFDGSQKVERRVQGDTVIDFVPSNDSSSHITNDIWHYFQCSRRQLRKEERAGEVHRHGRYCKRIKSVKHVTWHIRSK
ncbi:hypothetical protein CO690_00120 (plasmid) [Rothia mucilaginosa]|uniref:Uncharacterized protein n=1 Tax=Rothia mucilaginosa TaxID=43675 RepID=A0A291DCD0_9MICC|nr:hypothetical protein [Rothia mucilaginosa]ATF62156.1 hypothetical protein CO690_00120 [Rothia mucilaginosa]